MRHIAIVGSGPSGLYCAEALLKLNPETRIDVIDRLPTPFGLVRSGVAADHQSTKNISRLFEKTLARPEVGYFGGVELERDLTLDELREFYDVVVIATGAALDRRLGIPGETLPGIFTSGKFVGWYNHHPDHADVELGAVHTAVVIGTGNVALDVARILAKTEAEFAGSDLDPDVVAHLEASGVRRIHIIGRSPAAVMKFTKVELTEFGELERARPVLGAGGADLEALDSGVPLILKTITSKEYGPREVEIVFEFGLKPVAFEGGERLEGVRFATADGSEVVREAQLAVTCIGYSSHGHGLELDGGKLRNDDGLIEPGLYVVGWAKRGPSGTVGTNRVEALAVAKKIDGEIVVGDRAGAQGLGALLASRGVSPADYAAWRRIDESEIGRAAAGRVRRKWRSLAELYEATKPVPQTTA